MPVLQPVDDAAAADAAAGHGVDPAVDGVTVRAEQPSAELLVRQAIVKDGSRDGDDLALAHGHAQRREPQQRIGSPRDAQQLRRGAAAGEGRERGGGEDYLRIFRHPDPLCEVARALHGLAAQARRAPQSAANALRQLACPARKLIVHSGRVGIVFRVPVHPLRIVSVLHRRSHEMSSPGSLDGDIARSTFRPPSTSSRPAA